MQRTAALALLTVIAGCGLFDDSGCKDHPFASLLVVDPAEQPVADAAVTVRSAAGTVVTCTSKTTVCVDSVYPGRGARGEVTGVYRLLGYADGDDSGYYDFTLTFSKDGWTGTIPARLSARGECTAHVALQGAASLTLR